MSAPAVSLGGPRAFCRDCLGDLDIKARRCGECGSPRLVRHHALPSLTLAHIDCDAFYATVEKRDNPELAEQARDHRRRQAGRGIGRRAATVMDAPDKIAKVRELFGIDSDMEVPAFSEADERVPDLDPAYVFDPDARWRSAPDSPRTGG